MEDEAADPPTVAIEISFNRRRQGRASNIWGFNAARYSARHTSTSLLLAACETAQRGGRHQGSVGNTGAIIGLVQRDALVLFGPVARCWSFLPCFAHSTIAHGSARRATTVPGSGR